MTPSFRSIYRHGFIRAAVCVPQVRVADPGFNVEHTVGLAKRASDAHAAVALFPELGLSAYTNEDLFHQDALLDATLAALARLVEASADLTPVLLVGAPLRFEGKLFNCAVVIYRVDKRSASHRKVSCPTTANFTRSGSSRPGATPSAARCRSSGARCRSAAT